MQGINLYPYKIARILNSSHRFQNLASIFFLFNMKSLQKFKAQDSIHSVLFLTKQLNHYVKLGMYSNI